MAAVAGVGVGMLRGAGDSPTFQNREVSKLQSFKNTVVLEDFDPILPNCYHAFQKILIPYSRFLRIY